MHDVQIIDYTSSYQPAFSSLNEEWISTYFTMEPEDYLLLNDPDKYIIQKDGFILLALLDNVAVGTCAMKKMDGSTYELCKMCVSPEAQGKKIGYRLCIAAIEKGWLLNAKKIYLETNSKLNAAIQLYHKLGFKQVDPLSSKYQRVDITMELVI